MLHRQKSMIQSRSKKSVDGYFLACLLFFLTLILFCIIIDIFIYFLNNKGKNSFKQRRQVSHSWAVPGDS